MSLGEILTNKLFKWVVLYPGFRKFVNWAYSDVMKMAQYHIGLAPGQVGKYILLVDDPQDAERVGAYFADTQAIARHREYHTFSGTLDGEKVSATSLGTGGPPAAIGLHELAAIGADTFIYLGNGFAPAHPAKKADLIVVKGAVRDEGTGLQYAPLAFPAIADLHVTECLIHACKENGAPFLTGLTRSTDRYYQAAESSAKFPHVLCSDTSTAAIFITASVLGKRAGALLQAGEGMQPLTDAHIAAGVAALRLLIAADGKAVIRR
jgi:uridine phosphorylase